MNPTCLTPQQYKAFILTSLSVAEPCAKEVLADQIDLLWSVNRALSACDDELHYLLTRRAAITLLMGCYTRQIDTRDARSESHSRSQQTQRSDGWSQAQQSNQAVAFADSVGTARYNDLSVGSGKSGSRRNASGSQYSDTYTKFDDIGSGASFTDSASSAAGQRQNVSTSTARTTGNGEERGGRSGCNYSISKSKTNGQGFNIGVAGGGFRSTGNTSDTFASSYAQQQQFDTRDGSNSRSVQGSSTQRSQSDRTSTSYFNALSDSSSKSISGSRSDDESSGFRDNEAHASGYGSGAGDSQARGNSASQATSLSRDEAEAHRTANRSGFAVLDDIKAHQRFLHLTALYDQATQLIDLKRKRVRGRAVRFGAMLTMYADGCCPAGALMAVKTVCGCGCSCGGCGCNSSGYAYGTPPQALPRGCGCTR